MAKYGLTGGAFGGFDMLFLCGAFGLLVGELVCCSCCGCCGKDLVDVTPVNADVSLKSRTVSSDFTDSKFLSCSEIDPLVMGALQNVSDDSRL